MSLKDLFVCMGLPSISLMAMCCKRLYLLCLCVLLVSMLLGIAVWATLNFHASRALIPLVAVTSLLSMAEGALILATLQSVNKKPMDYESQDQPTHVNGAAPSDRAGPLNQALVHPAYRDYNMSSLDSTRNFSLPRERCLDPATPANTPAIPIPHAYVATGIISSDMSTRRPLPPLPVEPNDIPVPPSRLEEVNDMTVLPLRVQKRECAVIDTAVTPPVHGCDVKSEEKPKSMPGDHDKIPVQFTHISMAEQIITGVAADQYPKDIDHETAKSIEKSLPEGPEVELQAPQTPARLVAPAIFVQQPTPTTPKVIDYPSATLAETSTIRLVSPFLEIPAMTGRCPRRKK